MQIEIAVESKLPKLYPLDKPRIMIGSDPSCDIVVSEVGVSRNHLLIFQDSGLIYAVDQNSTNGSFINDQLLIAGLKNLLTPPVTIFLGAAVTITVLSDEDISARTGPKTASMVDRTSDKIDVRDFRKKTSIKDFKPQASDPKGSIYKRTPTVTGDQTVLLKLDRSKLEVKKKKINPMYVLAALVIGAGVYFTQFTSEEEVQSVPSLKPRPKPVPLVAQKPVGLENLKLPTKEKITALFSKAKCAKAPESELCKFFAIPATDPAWGVVSEDKDLFVFLPLDAAMTIVKQQLKTEVTPKQLIEVSVAQGLMSSTTQEINYSQLVNYKLVYAFYETGAGTGPQLKATALISPDNLQSMRVIMGRLLGRLGETGPSAAAIGHSLYHLETY